MLKRGWIWTYIFEKLVYFTLMHELTKRYKVLLFIIIFFTLPYLYTWKNWRKDKVDDQMYVVISFWKENMSELISIAMIVQSRWKRERERDVSSSLQKNKKKDHNTYSNLSLNFLHTTKHLWTCNDEFCIETHTKV